MTTFALLVILCLALSAFFSGAEMAYISSNKLKFREMADAGDPRARILSGLLANPHRFLTTILIGNNIVNVAATSLIAYWVQTHFNLHSEWLVTALAAPLLIIFGETVPKDYGRLRSQQFLIGCAHALNWLDRLFFIPTNILIRVTDFFLGPAATDIRKSIFVDEEEFRLLIEESTQSGVLNTHEKKLIETILDFERTRVEGVMAPLDKAAQVDIHATLREVKDAARRFHARMVLVYEEIPTIIVGMIYVFDIVFEENEDQGLKDFLRSPTFLPASTSIEKAFLTLQHRRQSYAVVTDAQGEAVGVVPIEKLLVV